MRADQIENKILKLEEHVEREKKYNYIIDQSFIIIYPTLAVTLFAIYWSRNRATISNYSEVLELALYAAATLLFTYLLANSRPIKKFIMEWYLLKRLIDLKTSRPSEKEIGKFLVSLLVSAIIVVSSIYFELFPPQYIFIVTYLIAFVISFFMLQIMTLVTRALFKTNLKIVTQIRGDWKKVVKFNLACSGIIIWIISGIIIGTL